jgi:hypothetical protein
MNTVFKVIALSTAMSVSAFTNSAYSHQNSGSEGNSMTGGKMMGDAKVIVGIREKWEF